MKRSISWRTTGIAVVAVPLSVVSFLPAPAVAAAAPAPVSNLQASSQNADYIYLTWTASPDTSSANACYLPGSTAPSSPTDPGSTCLGLTTSGGGSFQGSDGQAYSITVFSYDPATSTYGQGVSVTNIVATDVPPPAPTQLASNNDGATGLFLTWTAQAVTDVKDYLVAWAGGTAVPPPPATEDSAHVTQHTSIFIGSLVSGAVYTFAVRARDAGGHVGPAAAVTASTRQPNLWLVDDSSGAPKTTSIWSAPDSASAAMPSTGTVRIGAAFYGHDVYGRTGNTQFLGSTPGAHAPYVAAGPSATVVAWTANAGAYYRLQSSSTAKWSGLGHPMARTGDRVAGVSLDSKRRIHLLVVRTKGTGRGLWYLTNASGSWTRSLVKGSAAGDVAALTRDPVTNQIVIVDRHRSPTVETVRVAVLAAVAAKPSTFATWLSTKNRAVQWRPTSVAAYGGTISVGMQRTSSPGSTSDGPYVLTGTATAHQHAARVAGTTAQDSQLFVSMPTARRALFSWQRRNAAWDPNQLGVWTALRSYYATSKSWSFASPRHWSTSAYDRSVGAFVDSDGHTHVVYFTVPADVTE